MGKPIRERTTDFVLSTTDVDNREKFTAIREYRELHDLISPMSPDANISLSWHYLDPLLRRRLSISCARQAIELRDTSLEIPHFVVQSTEMRKSACQIEMADFTLRASGIFEPDELFERYETLRQNLAYMIDQQIGLF